MTVPSQTGTYTPQYQVEYGESGWFGDLVGQSVRVYTAPVASFTSSSIIFYNWVLFTDTSTGDPTSWQWNFGDGSPNSTLNNPQHVYAENGVYTVTLTAINDLGSSTIVKNNYILVGSFVGG